MIGKSNLPAVLVAMALAGAPTAYAATGTGGAAPPAAKQPAAPAAAQPKIHYIEYSDRVSRKDIAAYGAAKITLDQAILAAEQNLHAKAVEAVFRAAPAQPHYVVWLMRKGRVLTARIDSVTGKVAQLGRGISDNRLFPVERSEFMATEHARMNLAGAVTFAQKTSGDKPIAASLEITDRTRGYEIVVVDKGMVQSVWVSPDNPMMTASK
jgi:hypothetical protein